MQGRRAIFIFASPSDQAQAGPAAGAKSLSAGVGLCGGVGILKC